MPRTVPGHRLALCALGIAALLSACGGEEQARQTASMSFAGQAVDRVPEAFQRARRQGIAVDVARPGTDPALAEQLFNWAERIFPQYFPSHASTLSEGPWLYRSYFQTRVMIGVTAGEVHLVGGPFGAEPIKVGRVGDYVQPALAVRASSHENVHGVDMPPRLLPALTDRTWGFRLWRNRAYADFEQTGALSYFVHDIRNSASDMWKKGMPHFFRVHPTDLNAEMEEITDQLLENPGEGCIGPHRSLVADFNGDGKPDIFVACTGPDYALPPGQAGEDSLLFLSQRSGRYRMSKVSLGGHGYPHGSSAADIDGDGFPDIVVADVTENVFDRSPIYALMNNRDGTFTKRSLGFPQYVWQPVWTVELLDLNGDGRLDLWVGASPGGSQASAFYTLTGPATFAQTPFARLPDRPVYTLDYDIAHRQGTAWVLSMNSDYTGMAIVAFDSKTSSLRTLYTNTEGFDRWQRVRPECATGISGVYFELIRLWKDKLVTDDSCRTPDIPVGAG